MSRTASGILFQKASQQFNADLNHVGKRRNLTMALKFGRIHEQINQRKQKERKGFILKTQHG
tara:strand:- start:755 stop:940 length:186 start_codon:yes stop_codon:yes gene_type:complete